MSKYSIIHSKRYKKSIKKLDNKALQEVQIVVQKLANGEILKEKYKDHKLKGAKRRIKTILSF